MGNCCNKDDMESESSANYLKLRLVSQKKSDSRSNSPPPEDPAFKVAVKQADVILRSPPLTGAAKDTDRDLRVAIRYLLEVINKANNPAAAAKASLQSEEKANYLKRQVSAEKARWSKRQLLKAITLSKQLRTYEPTVTDSEVHQAAASFLSDFEVWAQHDPEFEVSKTAFQKSVKSEYSYSQPTAQFNPNLAMVESESQGVSK